MEKYNNLKVEIARNGLKSKDIALVLGLSASAIGKKINGKSDFRASEAAQIKREFFPNLSMDYLFRIYCSEE